MKQKTRRLPIPADSDSVPVSADIAVRSPPIPFNLDDGKDWSHHLTQLQHPNWLGRMSQLITP